MKYKSKLVVIEAIQFDGTMKSIGRMLSEWPAFKGCAEYREITDKCTWLVIRTLEGDMAVNPNYYVIKGTIGEFYPCKPDVFHNKYEPADKPVLDDDDGRMSEYPTVRCSHDTIVNIDDDPTELKHQYNFSEE